MMSLMPLLGVQAQKYLFGGTMAFDHTKSETTVSNGTSSTVEGPTSSMFAFSPFAGIFLNKNFVVGLGVSYETEMSKQKDIMSVDEYKVSENMISIYPMVRYYYRALDNAGLFLDGNVALGFGKNTEEFIDGSVTESEEADLSGMSIGVFPGLYINVTDYMSFEARFGGLQYASFGRKMEVDDVKTEYKGSSFAFEFNPWFFEFGVSFEIGD